ncbi:MAG: hypothetical protein HQK54_02305 [Oligoflexales bacterium]|nr:hypothetical protein [Oligoflexales bacterium]
MAPLKQPMPSSPAETKAQAPTTENLDRMKAEGKLNLQNKQNSDAKINDSVLPAKEEESTLNKKASNIPKKAKTDNQSSTGSAMNT